MLILSVDEVKKKVADVLSEEAQQWIGCGMTYTLFECLKERVAELMEGQPAHEDEEVDEEDSNDETGTDESDDNSDADIGKLSIGGKSSDKKEHLTKAQKRRMWDQTTGGGERARGHDWVDIVKHLSQCGNKDEAGSIPQNYEG